MSLYHLKGAQSMEVWCKTDGFKGLQRIEQLR